MASIASEPNGHRRLLFTAPDGNRKSIRLGKCSQKDAERISGHIEHISTSKLPGQPIPRETALWIGSIGHKLHDRLARSGLIERRVAPEVMGLAPFIDTYMAQRPDLKPNTLVLMKQARIWLLRYLGDDRRLDQVTTSDADGYKAHMVSSGLAKATIAKRCRYARHFFDVAKRRGLVATNPFQHIKGAVQGNPARRCFVPGDLIAKVIEVAPDPQWKLLIALARWGGLRVPTEALALTWRDVDFESKRFIVRAEKTAHHEDGGIRMVPMFPELLPLFHAVFDDAPEGTTHVISRYRSANVNLRTQFQRYIEKAGAKPWPKLWQNLRASRATELADQFPSHVCAAWLGHTERIADSFYRQVTDEHFAKASGNRPLPTQSPPGDRPNRPSYLPAENREDDDHPANKPAQIPAQQVAARYGNVSQDANAKKENPPIYGGFSSSAEKCESPEGDGMGVTGLEPVTPSVSCWCASQLRQTPDLSLRRGDRLQEARL